MSRSGKPKIMELFQIKGDSGLSLIPEKLNSKKKLVNLNKVYRGFWGC